MVIRFELSGEETAETPCYRSLNLLAHAQLEELEIGSRCGGHGVCGGDRVRVANRDQRMTLSPPTEAEKRHLTAEELASGWRLACQCFPAQDALELTLTLAHR